MNIVRASKQIEAGYAKDPKKKGMRLTISLDMPYMNNRAMKLC